MLFCQTCQICFSGSFGKVPRPAGPRLAASNFLNPRRPPSTAIVPISATIAQLSDEKTDWEKSHARDRSCFAQYRNNGFAAHRRRRQAPVERAREPGGGGQQKLVRDLFLERHQRQLQFCHATTVSGPGVGARWLLPTQSVSGHGVWDRLHLGSVALELRRVRRPVRRQTT